MEKELDLEKVLHRLRLFVFSTLGTLTKDQSIFADRMSRIVIRESSDHAESSDQELKHENKDVLSSARRLNLSSNLTDKRFLKVYQIRNALREEKNLPEDIHLLQTPFNRLQEG